MNKLEIQQNDTNGDELKVTCTCGYEYTLCLDCYAGCPRCGLSHEDEVQEFRAYMAANT